MAAVGWFAACATPETSVMPRRIRQCLSQATSSLCRSRKFASLVRLTMAVTVPQPGPDLNPHVPDLQKRAMQDSGG